MPNTYFLKTTEIFASFVLLILDDESSSYLHSPVSVVGQSVAPGMTPYSDSASGMVGLWAEEILAHLLSGMAE